jgi:hypothetical protein
MRSKVEQYVQSRIDATRKELARDTRRQEIIPVSYEQYDAIAERIARRISQAMSKQQAGRYQGKPEATRPRYQGQYADEILRQSGLYEREWKRLHGEN